MSIWTRISKTISSLTSGESLSSVFENRRTPPERSVAFTIAVIALSAKMAKADGLVTRDEVMAFREVFTLPAQEEDNAALVYNMARQDVAGYRDYAQRIRRMFGDGHEALFNLMEGLFHIATADDQYSDEEDSFLSDVAQIFGISDSEFRCLRARWVPSAEHDPWVILGIEPDAHLEEARQAWKRIVRDCHPDRMMANDVPEEARQIAEDRLVAVNQAWEEIQRMHTL